MSVTSLSSFPEGRQPIQTKITTPVFSVLHLTEMQFVCVFNKMSWNMSPVVLKWASSKVLFLSVALQSPIVYHNQQSGGGNSSSLTRNRSSSGNQTTASSHSRPSSVVGLCSTEKGKSQVKVSTSNGGSSCFDSMVSVCRLYDYQLTFILFFYYFYF